VFCAPTEILVQRTIDATKMGQALLQPLRLRCVDFVIHHERDVREEYHHYVRSANKQ